MKELRSDIDGRKFKQGIQERLASVNTKQELVELGREVIEQLRWRLRKYRAGGLLRFKKDEGLPAVGRIQIEFLEKIFACLETGLPSLDHVTNPATKEFAYCRHLLYAMVEPERFDLVNRKVPSSFQRFINDAEDGLAAERAKQYNALVDILDFYKDGSSANKQLSGWERFKLAKDYWIHGQFLRDPKYKDHQQTLTLIQRLALINPVFLDRLFKVIGQDGRSIFSLTEEEKLARLERVSEEVHKIFFELQAVQIEILSEKVDQYVRGTLDRKFFLKAAYEDIGELFDGAINVQKVLQDIARKFLLGEIEEVAQLDDQLAAVVRQDRTNQYLKAIQQGDDPVPIMDAGTPETKALSQLFALFGGNAAKAQKVYHRLSYTYATLCVVDTGNNKELLEKLFTATTAEEQKSVIAELKAKNKIKGVDKSIRHILNFIRLFGSNREEAKSLWDGIISIINKYSVGFQDDNFPDLFNFDNLFNKIAAYQIEQNRIQAGKMHAYLLRKQEKLAKQKAEIDSQLKMLKRGIHHFQEEHGFQARLEHQKQKILLEDSYTYSKEAKDYIAPAKQNIRRKKRENKFIATLVGASVGVGEGTVAGVGMGMFLMSLGLAGLAGPIGWGIAIAAGVIVFAAGAVCNYYLIKLDTYDVLNQFRLGYFWKDDNGKPLSWSKKIAMGFGGSLAIGGGFSYGALSFFAMKTSVLAPLLAKAGLTGAVLFGVSSGLASFFVIPTAIGITCMFYFVIGDFIKYERWKGIAKYTRKNFVEPFRGVSTGKEFAFACAEVVFNGLKILTGLLLNIAITVVSFGVFHRKGVDLLTSFAVGPSLASTISTVMVSISVSVGFVFGVRKIDSLTQKWTPRDVAAVSARIGFGLLDLAFRTIALAPRIIIAKPVTMLINKVFGTRINLGFWKSPLAKSVYARLDRFQHPHHKQVPAIELSPFQQVASQTTEVKRTFLASTTLANAAGQAGMMMPEAGLLKTATAGVLASGPVNQGVTAASEGAWSAGPNYISTMRTVTSVRTVSDSALLGQQSSMSDAPQSNNSDNVSASHYVVSPAGTIRNPLLAGAPNPEQGSANEAAKRTQRIQQKAAKDNVRTLHVCGYGSLFARTRGKGKQSVVEALRPPRKVH